LEKQKFAGITRAVLDEKNWVPLVRGFSYEASLSDYIASAPHLLEDGMRPYPLKKAREQVFADKTRSDVLLLDKHEKLVIVECKQGSPTVENIEQLRGYMGHAARWANVKSVRGVLVHGGSLNLSADIRSAAHESPSVELVRYAISVGFVRSL
jgi:RecB family endonuclease NucS